MSDEIKETASNQLASNIEVIRLIEQEDFKQAEKTIKQNQEIISKYFGEDSLEFALNLSQMGLLYANLARYKDAIFCYDRSLGICSRSGYSTLLVEISEGYGDVYFQQKDYDKSIRLYHKGLEQAKQIKYKQRDRSLYSKLCIAYLLTGDMIRSEIYFKELRHEGFIRKSTTFMQALQTELQTKYPFLLQNIVTNQKDGFDIDSNQMEVGKTYSFIHDDITYLISKNEKNELVIGVP